MTVGSATQYGLIMLPTTARGLALQGVCDSVACHIRQQAGLSYGPGCVGDTSSAYRPNEPEEGVFQLLKVDFIRL